jgi:vancomycin resistance protein YoaR
MRTFLKLTALFAIASVLIAASMIVYDFIITRNSFPPDTYIYDVEVSGLSIWEARRKLENIPLSELYLRHLSFEAEGKQYGFPPEDLGIHLLAKETVKKAFELTHKGNYLQELQERMKNGSTVSPLVLGIYQKRLKKTLGALAKMIETEPRDASIEVYDNEAYHIEPHVPGRKVDIDRTLSDFKRNFYKGQQVTRITIHYSYPEILENDLRDHPPAFRISAYTTYYGSHDSPNRIHNIQLVASWINGTLLMPGEVFSVSEALGDVEPEKGFKEAFVILGGELVPQLGGGACQIATTLYNAVSLADLKVLQRRNHSFYFNIYPLGRDATIFQPSLDFKFENDTNTPILIKAFATKRRLSFRIYGTPSEKKVRFSKVSLVGKNEEGEYEPMTLKKVIELDVPFKTEITRTVYDKHWRKIKTEEIKSYYKMYGDRENVPIRSPEPR